MGLIACICEGAAEEAVIEILLDANKLIFTRDEMLEGEPIRTRGAEKFQERYLRKGFSDKITVYRILDSRRERFVLSKAYEPKVDVINVITAPEIEMLAILSEDKYADYKKSGKKPSEYCKSDLRYRNVKSEEFLKDYFSNVDLLVAAILEYRRVSKIQAGERTLADLLK
ncbi:MAG: hypothetical protein ACI4KA_11410 [Oscillospiraceae bacterium]